jgi:hypothetical protein
MSRPPDDDVAEAIDLTRMCQELHCLPQEGGLLDQDSKYVWWMRLVLQADVEAAKHDAKRGGSGGT